jgi:hypothetical protein
LRAAGIDVVALPALAEVQAAIEASRQPALFPVDQEGAA